jgi:cytochrome P450 family 142 subfamily A polypeptide 1
MLVARRFTPKAVGQWEEHVRDVVRHLVDAVVAKGEAEIINELAAPLPAMMIGLLLGYPDDMWPKLQEWSERTIKLGGGPRYHEADGIEAAMEFAGACAELYEQKQACPADDVMSVWTRAEIPGHDFGLPEVISDCLLLLDGGAETTRTVIARTILELTRNPDAHAQLRDGADLTVAVEEFIRWVTPIHNMCRVATRDFDLSGTTIRAGDQVLLMYSSANRDPAHFADPERFDVRRRPNHHLAFGFGTHFCLGASLARLEIKLFLEEFLARTRNLAIKPGTTPVEMPNAFVYGLKEAHITFEGS